MHTGIALVTGSEDRQWLYAAMTRGTDTNLAFVFTTPPKPADPQPGTRPAPELDRYDRIRRERDGFLPTQPAPRQADRTRASRSPCSPTCWTATAPSCRPPRPGSAIWPTPTTWRPGRDLDRRNPRRPRRPLPPARHGRAPARPSAGTVHQARWLYRTLRAAELAGLDPAEVTRTAIASRDLAGARDIAAVLDARIRQRVHPLLPQPQGPWPSASPTWPTPTGRLTWPRSPP